MVIQSIKILGNVHHPNDFTFFKIPERLSMNFFMVGFHSKKKYMDRRKCINVHTYLRPTTKQSTTTLWSVGGGKSNSCVWGVLRGTENRSLSARSDQLLNSIYAKVRLHSMRSRMRVVIVRLGRTTIWKSPWQIITITHHHTTDWITQKWTLPNQRIVFKRCFAFVSIGYYSLG